jgi:hypothetical protein
MNTAAALEARKTRRSRMIAAALSVAFKTFCRFKNPTIRFSKGTATRIGV